MTIFLPKKTGNSAEKRNTETKAKAENKGEISITDILGSMATGTDEELAEIGILYVFCNVFSPMILLLNMISIYIRILDNFPRRQELWKRRV